MLYPALMGIVNTLLLGVYLEFIFFTQGKTNSINLIKPKKLEEESLPRIQTVA